LKLVSIQVLRAVAAVLVVMHHAQFEGAVLAGRTGQPFEPSQRLPWAAGVDIFFVISGFIVVHAARPLYGRADGRVRFLAHRIARLVPLYWLATALYLAVLVGAPTLLGSTAPIAPGYVAASFLFWPTLDPSGQAQPLYSLGWTLNFEMLFYVLFAVGIGRGRRAAFAFVAVCLGLLVIARMLLTDPPMPLAFWGAPITLEFALGAAVGLARAEGLRLSVLPRLCLGAAGFALLSVAEEPTLLTRPLAYGVPSVLLVAAAGLGSTTPLPASSRLVTWGVLLGDASYALYLVHPFVLRAGREALVRTDLAFGLGPWPSIVLLSGLSVAVALAVHRYVERPLTRRTRALLDPGSDDLRPVQKSV
jgi:peptidoglycan/LPS O-acetylase OafA/YrhL